MITLKRGKYTIYISEKADGTAREIPKFIYAKQVHGNTIDIIKNKPHGFINEEYDGLLSNITNMCIGVLVADCNGVLLLGKNRYGAIHAGWRGLQSNIIEKAIHMLELQGEKIQNIKVYIGPSIRSCCYEVGNEFLSYFDQKYFRKIHGKLYLDMIAKINDILDESGIKKENREIHPSCTACSENYFSYRKGNNNQRIVVGIKKNR